MTNSSAIRHFLAFSLVSAFFFGCAAAPARKPVAQEAAPPLTIARLSPDKAAPQAAEMATVRWKVDATGGAGKREYSFWSFNGIVEVAEQKGPSPTWDWRPAEPGDYRVKAVVRDSIGNKVESGWSTPYVVVPKLVVSSPAPDFPSPQPALISTIRWTAEAEGGVGDRVYTYSVIDVKEEKIVQSGPSASWEWSPRNAGMYRVKVTVRDLIGNTAESGWSPGYEIGRPVEEKSLIAVMPMENLTGTVVPFKELRRSFLEGVKSRGIEILEDGALEKFMERHRVRYTGGLNKEVSEALRKETGAIAVLFVTLNQYDESLPPKIALVSRLVSTGAKPVILWMDGVDAAGNDEPGVLGIGLIQDSRKLWKKALEKLLESLAGYVAGEERRGLGEGDARFAKRDRAKGKFQPKNFYGTLPKVPAGRQAVSIAVLPFLNESTRRNAGEIMALHFLKSLSEEENIEVIESGVVRQALLMSRTIMEGGLSLPQADLLHTMLDVDLVLTGIVTDYKDFSGTWGNAEVDFSTRVFDTNKRQVVWTSTSHNRGDDGVFFFNLGRVNTAHGMASGMVRAVVGKMAESVGE